MEESSSLSLSVRQRSYGGLIQLIYNNGGINNGGIYFTAVEPERCADLNSWYRSKKFQIGSIDLS
jgi:hypothetical protein